MSEKVKKTKKSTRKVTKNKKLQSRVAMSDLKDPQSRVEHYLHYINKTDRALPFDQLPKPQSRVEWLLYYLCEHGAGGGVQLPINAIDVNFDDTINLGAGTVQEAIEILKELIENVSGVHIVEDEPDLQTLLQSDLLKTNDLIFVINPVNVVDYQSNVVTKKDKPISMIYDETLTGNQLRLFSRTGEVEDWEDLSNTYKLSNVNLYNVLDVVYGERYDTSTGAIEYISDWARIEIDVTGGQQYTIIKNSHDSSTCVYLDADGNPLQRIGNGGNDVNGKRKYLLNIPTDVQGTPVAKLGFNIYPQRKDDIEDIMVFVGDIDVPNHTIPYTQGADVIVDGSKVSIAFDNRNSSFLSQTVAGAIHELKGHIDGIYGDFVEDWEDLSHVISYENVNLANFNERIVGYSYGRDRNNGDTWREDAGWSTLFVDVEQGQTYSVYMKGVTGVTRIIYTDDVGGAKIDAGDYTLTTGVVYNYRSLTVPTRNPQITKMAIQFDNTIIDSKDDIMVFKGTVTTVEEYIPFSDTNAVQIGTGISYAFDGTGTDLQSDTIHQVIKELNTKISKAGKVESVNGIEPTQGTKNVVLTATPSYIDDKLKLTTSGSAVVFTEIECMTQEEAEQIKAQFII